MMEVEEALSEIENTLRKIDPILLYRSNIGKELQNILRRLRDEKRPGVISDIQRL